MKNGLYEHEGLIASLVAVVRKEGVEWKITRGDALLVISNIAWGSRVDVKKAPSLRTTTTSRGSRRRSTTLLVSSRTCRMRHCARYVSLNPRRFSSLPATTSCAPWIAWIRSRAVSCAGWPSRSARRFSCNLGTNIS